MNSSPIFETHAVQETAVFGGDSRRPSVWRRLLMAFVMLAMTAAAGVGAWIFGMLMFTFCLDGASSHQLPKWLDAFMLVGWPVSIGLVVLVPPLLMACGASWKTVVVAFLTTVLISIAIFMAGVATLFSSLA